VGNEHTSSSESEDEGDENDEDEELKRARKRRRLSSPEREVAIVASALPPEIWYKVFRMLPSLLKEGREYRTVSEVCESWKSLLPEAISKVSPDTAYEDADVFDLMSVAKRTKVLDMVYWNDGTARSEPPAVLRTPDAMKKLKELEYLRVGVWDWIRVEDVLYDLVNLTELSIVNYDRRVHQNAIERLINLASLEFCDVPAMEVIVVNSSKLTSLTFVDCPNFESVAYFEPFEKLKALKFENVGYDSVYDFPTFSLTGPDDVYTESLSDFVSESRSLTSLHLTGFTRGGKQKIQGYATESMGGEALTSRMDVRLEGIEEGDTSEESYEYEYDVPIKKRLTLPDRLTELKFDHTVNFVDGCLSKLANLTSLTAMYGYKPSIDPRYEIFDETLAPLTKLTKLHLEDCSMVTGEAFYDMVRLKKVNLVNLYRLLPDALKYTAGLEKITIVGCPATLKTYERSKKSATSLRLGNVDVFESPMRDETGNVIVDEMGNPIVVSNIAYANDEMKRASASGKTEVRVDASLPEFSNLSFLGLYSVRHPALSALLANVTRLAGLEIVGCPDVSDDAVAALTLVSRLTLVECPQLTRDAVIELTNLTSLSVEYSTLGRDATSFLHLTRLRRLNLKGVFATDDVVALREDPNENVLDDFPYMTRSNVMFW
jgi:hypothetical protein